MEYEILRPDPGLIILSSIVFLAFLTFLGVLIWAVVRFLRR